MNTKPKVDSSRAFTIVELVLVIVVIGILAGITTIAWSGWRQNAAKSEVKSDLLTVASAMESAKNFGSGYPTSIPSNFSSSSNVTITYTSGDSSSYCIDGASKAVAAVTYFVSSTSKNPVSGTCAAGGGGGGGGGGSGTIASGDPIQTVTNTNCPTTRTMVVDARDNHTYWVQKLADGKCWMLTNLAYAGGGTNTYGDVKSITNGASQAASYTTAYYYIPTGANPTTSPTTPSTSTSGTGQYGYLYNWCAAMGVQTSTSACNGTSTPTPNLTISICPQGWKLPYENTGWKGATESAGTDFTDLNGSVNSGSTTTDAGLRSNWLEQRNGSWQSGFSGQGTFGIYWASYSNTTLNVNAIILYADNGSSSSTIRPAAGVGKRDGNAVRCIVQ
jgi:uncharacterized protein (TIGR02145 family)/prepilin-type N-terminal cleavage/methylation domain-containing protein